MDAVVLVHRYEPATGAAVLNSANRWMKADAIPTGQQLAARFDGRGKEALWKH